MSYINVYAFFEDSKKAWRKKIVAENEREKYRQSNPQQSLFPLQDAYF